jgi:hypothetical protein
MTSHNRYHPTLTIVSVQSEEPDPPPEEKTVTAQVKYAQDTKELTVDVTTTGDTPTHIFKSTQSDTFQPGFETSEGQFTYTSEDQLQGEVAVSGKATLTITWENGATLTMQLPAADVSGTGTWEAVDVRIIDSISTEVP